MNSKKRCHELFVFGAGAGLPAGGGEAESVAGFAVGVELVCAGLVGFEKVGGVFVSASGALRVLGGSTSDGGVVK